MADTGAGTDQAAVGGAITQRGTSPGSKRQQPRHRQSNRAARGWRISIGRAGAPRSTRRARGHVVHGQLAEAVSKSVDQLRVTSGNVGGAFGMKIFLHPE
jgi:hypothetical protein